MSPKWGWVAVGVLGAAAVMAILLAGRDPFPAARSGPRWRRRLLGAGLAALSVLGFILLKQVQEKLAPPPAPEPAPEPPPEPPPWDPVADRMKDAIRALETALAAWPDDADIARELLGRVDDELDTVPREPPEDWFSPDSHWLNMDAVMHVTASPTPGEVERSRLCRRLEELQHQAADRLYGMTSDITDTFEWLTIARAWRGAAAWDHAIFHGGSVWERRCADWNLSLASEAIGKLDRKGLLLKAEADLLWGEAGRLGESIYENSPDDMLIMCYVRVYVDPAKASTERLRQRVGLLRELSADRKITAAVLGKVAASIRNDIEESAGRGMRRLLLGGNEPAPLSEEEDELRREVARLLQNLEPS
jgi:hypothetical protein